MKTIINRANILDCGVWHKASQTRSSLDEAIAALGSDCMIINGNMFDMGGVNDGRPNDAYTVGGKAYCTGGV